jgi:flagellar biosynthesis/type III secretory pathway chaperone
VVIALGLSPEDQRRRLDEHIAERREDTEFMERLKRRVEEDRPVLERLKKSDGLGGSAD